MDLVIRLIYGLGVVLLAIGVIIFITSLLDIYGDFTTAIGMLIAGIIAVVVARVIGGTSTRI